MEDLRYCEDDPEEDEKLERALNCARGYVLPRVFEHLEHISHVPGNKWVSEPRRGTLEPSEGETGDTTAW